MLATAQMSSLSYTHSLSKPHRRISLPARALLLTQAHETGRRGCHGRSHDLSHFLSCLPLFQGRWKQVARRQSGSRSPGAVMPSACPAAHCSATRIVGRSLSRSQVLVFTAGAISIKPTNPPTSPGGTPARGQDCFVEVLGRNFFVASSAQDSAGAGQSSRRIEGPKYVRSFVEWHPRLFPHTNKLKSCAMLSCSRSI